MNLAEMIELAKVVAQFRNDPLGFVLNCYPWGEGELAGFAGPDANQREFLESLGEEIRKRDFDGKNPVMPIRMAETSGHGTGKSAMGAWIGNFLMSTRPWSVGTITAGTATQMIHRTFSAYRKWTKLCITADWWEIRKTAIYIKQELCRPDESPENWKVVAQTCKEENAQSFAGQHAATSTCGICLTKPQPFPTAYIRLPTAA